MLQRSHLSRAGGKAKEMEPCRSIVQSPVGFLLASSREIQSIYLVNVSIRQVPFPTHKKRTGCQLREPVHSTLQRVTSWYHRTHLFLFVFGKLSLCVSKRACVINICGTSTNNVKYDSAIIAKLRIGNELEPRGNLIIFGLRAKKTFIRPKRALPWPC